MKKALTGIIFAALMLIALPAAAGIFDAPGGGAGGSDLADNWLGHVFKQLPFVVEVPGIGAQNAPVGGTTTTMDGTMPQLFQRLCAMYSTAMLVLAVIILVYHLIGMTVATAHDGRPMGKSAHQVWTPIRLVFALGLLVPIANGFSSGQYLVMWVAKQGSGLASYVWGAPAAGIGGQFMSQNPRSVVQPDVKPEAMVQTLVGIGVCAKKQQQELASDLGVYLKAPPLVAQNVYNALVLDPNNGNPLTHPGAAAVQKSGKQLLIDGAGVDGQPGSLSKKYYAASADNPLSGGIPPGGTYQYWPEQRPCGTVTLPALVHDPAALVNPVTAASAALQRAHLVAFTRIEGAALQVGASLQTAQWRGTDGITIPIYNGTTFIDTPLTAGAGVKEAVDGLVKAYRDTYAQTLQNAANLTYCTDASPRGGGSPCSGVPNDHVVYEPTVGALGGLLQINYNSGLGGAQDLGWMSAGGFFINAATRANALGAGAASAPVVKGEDDCNDQAGCGKAAETVGIQLDFESEKTTVTDGYQECSITSNPFSCLTNGFRWVLSKVGLANDNGQWLWHTQFTSPHPLGDMITLGGKLVDGSVLLVGLGMACAVAGAGLEVATDRMGNWLSGALTSKVTSLMWGATIGKLVNNIAKAGAWVLAIFGVLFFMLATTIFLPGVLLFYILPLLPFFNFLTGILTWMMSLLQAVVAIPLIAIAHLSPHGEGLPTTSARGAYTMILQIFLRPIMMIFGLLVCVIIMNTGLAILNTLFFGVYKFHMFGNAAGLLSNIIFFIIYAIAAFAVCNVAITAIDEFPMNAIRWIGGNNLDKDHPVDKFAASQVFGQANAVVGRGAARLESGAENLGKRLASSGQGRGKGGTATKTGVLYGESIEKRAANEANNAAGKSE